MTPGGTRLGAALLTLALVLSGCSGGSSGNGNASPDEVEYAFIQTELKMAATDRPYLVLNFKNQTLDIKLKGVVVWSNPVTIVGDDAGLAADFARKFRGNHPSAVRPILEKHLYAAQKKTPDTVLSIVSNVTKVKPELMQREVPQRFELLWGDGLSLEVQTDVVGTPESGFKNTIFEVREALRFGNVQIRLQMAPEHALTLYRASDPGLPTIVLPQ